jgi:plastocyanin
LAVTALAVLLVGAACQSQTAAASKSVAITLATTEFKFTPDTATARVGDHVKVALDNRDTLKHDLRQADLSLAAKGQLVISLPVLRGPFHKASLGALRSAPRTPWSRAQ